MSKLTYFKRYLYVVDRLRSFTALQEYVIRKFKKKDIDFEYAIRTERYGSSFWNRYSVQL